MRLVVAVVSLSIAVGCSEDPAPSPEPSPPLPDSSPACHPGDRLRIQLYRDGEPDNLPRRVEFTATVVESSDTVIAVEACPGSGAGGAGGVGSDCSAEDLRLEIEAPGIGPGLELGTTVNVVSDRAGGGYGGSDPLVKLSAPDDTTVGGFLLGATFGFPFPDWPVSVRQKQLDCDFSPTNNVCGGPLAYSLAFTAAANPSSSVDLTMSETGTLALDPDDDEASWRVRNIRSYSSGACDETGTTQYTLVKNL